MIHSRFTVQRTVFSNQPLLLLLEKEEFKYTEFRYGEPIDTANRPKIPLAPSIESPLYVDKSTSERSVWERALHLFPKDHMCSHSAVASVWCGDRRWMALMTTVKLRSLWKLATYVVCMPFPYLTTCVYERQPHYPPLRAGSYYYNTYFIQMRCWEKKRGRKLKNERNRAIGHIFPHLHTSHTIWLKITDDITVRRLASASLRRRSHHRALHNTSSFFFVCWFTLFIRRMKEETNDRMF